MNNLVARLPGKGRAIMLAAHMDTVMPGRGIKPVVRDGVVHSDGSTILGADDKAGVAVILEVLQAVVENSLPHPPLEVVITVQEESGLVGAKGLDLQRLTASMGVSLDAGGSPGTITVSAPSHNFVVATVHGKAAHAGTQPETGINAIAVAAHAIVDMPLGRIDEETTANIGTIQGGTAKNIVPDRVELAGEARSRNEAKLEAQTAKMVQAFQLAAQRYGAKVDVRVTHAYEAYVFSEAEEVVRRLMVACRAQGVQPVLVPTGGGSDANIFNAQGKQVVNLSVGMGGEHSTDEHIAVADMVICAQIVLRFVADLNS
jgi:tripeptide aminopeptidase